MFLNSTDLGESTIQADGVHVQIVYYSSAKSSKVPSVRRPSKFMFHFSRTHFAELVDRVCIARILETESQLRSCHKTVPFKLFSKNLGASMCTQVCAWMLYVYNILLEHNTVEGKQALYFYTRIKQETFVWINITADRFLPPSEHPPLHPQQPSALGQTYVLCMCLTAVKIKFSFFLSANDCFDVPEHIFYLFFYIYLYIFFFINSIPVRISPAYMTTLDALTSDDI